jgi:hypothetical protein
MATDISIFAAKYPGRCAECDQDFEPGDPVGYTDEGQLVGMLCCYESPHRPIDEAVRKATGHTTLPRGKTKADRCDTCFQIPSSNGVCGCF